MEREEEALGGVRKKKRLGSRESQCQMNSAKDGDYGCWGPQRVSCVFCVYFTVSASCKMAVSPGLWLASISSQACQAISALLKGENPMYFPL